MIDVKNLSKIKMINVLHFEFDFRYKRLEIGNEYYTHYPVAYINEEYLYYIVCRKQPLKFVYTKAVSDDLCDLDKEIDARLKNGYGNFNFVFVGSKEEAYKKFKEISEKIRSRRDCLREFSEKDKDSKKYQECLEFISWYNKKYPN